MPRSTLSLLTTVPVGVKSASSEKGASQVRETASEKSFLVITEPVLFQGFSSPKSTSVTSGIFALHSRATKLVNPVSV